MNCIKPFKTRYFGYVPCGMCISCRNNRDKVRKELLKCFGVKIDRQRT